jgi:F5/8 type C domain
MKRCPKCNRKYQDETLRFCLEDGTVLAAARDSEPPATEILPPRAAPTLKSSGPTVPSYLSGADLPAQHQTRPANPILTAGVVAIAVLLLALVGIAAFFVLRQPAANQVAANDPGNSPAARQGSSPGRSKTDPANVVEDQNESHLTTSQNGAPLKINATSSSVRLAVQSNTYYPANAIDGKRSTAWIEGADGAGLGEWIRFDFDRQITVHRILFQPGYFKSPQIWAENNRLATVTAEFSDGSSREITFDNRMDSQKFDVGAVKTRWVRLVIKSVYYGTDPDTALSEVAFEWEP